MQAQGKPEDNVEAPAPTAPQVERRSVGVVEFGTVMAHFYRGEISRANIWRQRLDTTFNWAVLTTGTALTFSFGSPEAPHVVILFTSVLMVVFLFIEARRYRYYEVWSGRVRVLETDYIAPMLSPRCRASTPRDAWKEILAEDLLRPQFTVGMWEAVGRRMRRNYLWIFFLLAGSWMVKIAVHPTPANSMDECIRRAAIGRLEGGIVIAIGFIFNGLLFAISFLTITLNQARGEVHSSHLRFRAPFFGRSSKKRQKGVSPGTTGTFKPLPRDTGTLSRVRDTGELEEEEDDETPALR